MASSHSSSSSTSSSDSDEDTPCKVVDTSTENTTKDKKGAPTLEANPCSGQHANGEEEAVSTIVDGKDCIEKGAQKVEEREDEDAEKAKATEVQGLEEEEDEEGEEEEEECQDDEEEGGDWEEEEEELGIKIEDLCDSEDLNKPQSQSFSLIVDAAAQEAARFEFDQPAQNHLQVEASIPDGVDAEVWKLLPRDMQEELREDLAADVSIATPEKAERRKEEGSSEKKIAVTMEERRVPDGVDPEVWRSLPDDVRAELQQLFGGAEGCSELADVPSAEEETCEAEPTKGYCKESATLHDTGIPDGVDAAFWSALPADVQAELLEGMRLEKPQKSTLAKTEVGTVLESFAIESREEQKPVLQSPPVDDAAPVARGLFVDASAQQAIDKKAPGAFKKLAHVLSFGRRRPEAAAPVTSSPPSASSSSTAPARRIACRYGIYCHEQCSEHLKRFTHPGDADYRLGVAVFEAGTHPQFQTLNDLFRFFDANESGHLSKQSFANALPFCQRLQAEHAGTLPARLDLKKAWRDAGGEQKGTVNFAQFTTWALSVRVGLPVGLAASKDKRPCRFQSLDEESEKCQCCDFQASSIPELCVCGHKISMHRSDAANLRSGKHMIASGLGWSPPVDGLIEIVDGELQNSLQCLLDGSHQESHNWTRDRGCSKHGINACSLGCASKNKVPVPTRFLLRKAFRNQNIELRHRYALTLAGIADECSQTSMATPFTAIPQPACCRFDYSLSNNSNEWRLFHGTSPQACDEILRSGFKVELAGSGATWRSRWKSKGTPLYGFGMYFAEKVTKADEYSKRCPKGHEFEGWYSMLVCRVIAGRVNVVTTNEIDGEKLRKEVFCGPYHSVLGDRIATLGKPYREVVVYDKDQVYPEFLLMYERLYTRAP